MILSGCSTKPTACCSNQQCAKQYRKEKSRARISNTYLSSGKVRLCAEPDRSTTTTSARETISERAISVSTSGLLVLVCAPDGRGRFTSGR